jgi:hypothetical protein
MAKVGGDSAMMSATVLVRTGGAGVAASRHVSDQEHPPLVDMVEMGHRVAGARRMAGCSSRPSGLAKIRAEGFAMADWALGAIERGERFPDANEVAVLTLVFAPPGGANFFYTSAMPADLGKRFSGMSCGD